MIGNLGVLGVSVTQVDFKALEINELLFWVLAVCNWLLIKENHKYIICKKIYYCNGLLYIYFCLSIDIIYNLAM